MRPDPPFTSLQDRKQPDVCDRFFHDVPFEAHFASDIAELQSMAAMPGVDGFTMKVDALYKVRGIRAHGGTKTRGLVAHAADARLSVADRWRRDTSGTCR